MHDEQARDRFIELRAQNWSFDRIARELHIAKSTLVLWSRQFQHDIQHLQTIRREARQERSLATEEARLQITGKQLEQVEAELTKRDLTNLPTWRLHTLAVLRCEKRCSPVIPEFPISSALLLTTLNAR